MTPTINPNGRIAGTRTSVFDIIPYLDGDRFTLEEIAKYNAITMDELRVALAYIEANREEVMRINREIDERHARGNPPELQAKLEQFSVRFRRFCESWVERRRADAAGNGSRRLLPPGKLMETFRDWMAREDEQEKQRGVS